MKAIKLKQKSMGPEHHKLLLGIIILIILVVLWQHIALQKQLEHFGNTLEGYWRADEDFLASAGLDALILYVGKDQGNWLTEKRTAKLIMAGPDAVIYDGMVELDMGYRPWFPASVYHRRLSLMDMDEPEDKSMIRIPIGEVMSGKPMDLYLDMNNGCMIWRDEQKKYAVLYRDWVNEPRQPSNSVSDMPDEQE